MDGTKQQPSFDIVLICLAVLYTERLRLIPTISLDEGHYLLFDGGHFGIAKTIKLLCSSDGVKGDSLKGLFAYEGARFAPHLFPD